MERIRWPALVAAAALLAPTAAACSKTAGIEDVFTALDGDGMRRRGRFTTDSKAVHCIIEFSASRPGATLEVLIRQIALPNGEPTNRVLVSVEQMPPRANRLQATGVQFRGTDETTGEPAGDEEPIPAGTYRCEARLDGELGGLAEFRVDFADCPPALIPDNTRCGGFYDPNKRCKKYGVTSTAAVDRLCTCTSGTWICDK